MKKIQIKNLTEGPVKIGGFVDTIRNQSKMAFIVVRDLTGKVQVTVNKEKLPEIAKIIDTLTPESVIEVEGQCVLTTFVKLGGKEIIPGAIFVHSIAQTVPISEESSIDKRFDYRWLDLRSEKNTLMIKVQSRIAQLFREFLAKEGFLEIHSPKTIAAASESGSEVFEIKYYNRRAYLAQSPQFYKQMAIAAGLEKVYEVGPVFRAENSHTNRHMTEFTSLDLEMAFIKSYEELMSLEENLLVYIFGKIKEELGEEIKRVFDTTIVVPTIPFPRIKVGTLNPIGDMTTDNERQSFKIAKEKYNSDFIFVTDFDKKHRGFYHMRENDVPQGADLIYKGVEITTCAQREHRYEILKKQAEEKGLKKDVEFYLEFFKYGCPPHGGMGIGLERITWLMLDMANIKEAAFIARDPDRITP